MKPPTRIPVPLRCGIEAIGEFDEIVDVRSPAEYADDHIPGAISAPVLDNQERARIGTIYTRESAFRATRLGAALVARHIADHLETTFADRPRSWQPLVYCWRGGKRSAAMASWLNQIGWHAHQLEGGYKRWRRHVIDSLATWPAGLACVVLAGPTGSGKTRLLQELGRAGAQILDLEELARHRGSLLGEMPDRPQPSQRGFETALHDAIRALDPGRPVFVEAESRRIGRLNLPEALFQAMRSGRCIHVRAQLPQRIAFLLQDYRHLFEAPQNFKRKLEQLTGLHSHQTVCKWQAMIDAREFPDLFEALVVQHYDPAYRRSTRTHFCGLAEAADFDYDPTATGDGTQARALLTWLSGAARRTAGT